MSFAVAHVWHGEVVELFGDVVSAGVRVSGLSWLVGELATVNLAFKVVASRSTLALFWNLLIKGGSQRLFFHTF